MRLAVRLGVNHVVGVVDRVQIHASVWAVGDIDRDSRLARSVVQGIWIHCRDFVKVRDPRRSPIELDMRDRKSFLPAIGQVSFYPVSDFYWKRSVSRDDTVCVHHRSDLSPGRSALINNRYDVLVQHTHHAIIYLRLASAQFSAVLEREHENEVADASPSYHHHPALPQ